MASRLLSTLTFLCAVSSLALRAQSSLHIRVNHPRPLEAALDALEAKLGIPINYEDPQFQCSNDVQDVTHQVQNAAQRAANPNARIIVPKGGALALDSVLASSAPAVADALSLVNQLRVKHEAKGYPGRFNVTQIGSVVTVQPSAVRASDCHWKSSAPAMGTHISFPAQSRDATETLTLILSTLTRKLGVEVGLGALPIMGFVSRSVTLGASDERADVVLAHLFQQLTAQDAVPARLSPTILTTCCTIRD